MSTSTPPVPEANNPIQPAVEGAKPLSEVERLGNVFVAPSKTFNDIRRNASWWVPWLLLGVISFTLAFTVDKKVGWDTVALNEIHANQKAADQLEQLKTSNPDQYAQRIAISTKGTKYFTMAAPIVGLIAAAIFAAILMAVFNFGLGAEITFGQSLAAFYYSALIRGVKTLLAIVALFAGGNPENFTLSNPIGTNLAYYMDPTTAPRALYAFGGWLDVISIAWMVVMGLGYATVAGKKKSTGIAVIVGIYFVLALIATAFAAI